MRIRCSSLKTLKIPTQPNSSGRMAVDVRKSMTLTFSRLFLKKPKSNEFVTKQENSRALPAPLPPRLIQSPDLSREDFS